MVGSLGGRPPDVVDEDLLERRLGDLEVGHARAMGDGGGKDGVGLGAGVDLDLGPVDARPQDARPGDAGEPRQSGKESKISVTLKEGISQEDAKKVGKLIRDEGPKGVKVQVQGDELRVTSKKRDDLQAVIALVKAQDYDFAVQFTNYR